MNDTDPYGLEAARAAGPFSPEWAAAVDREAADRGPEHGMATVRPDHLRAQLAEEHAAALTPGATPDTLRSALERLCDRFDPNGRGIPVPTLRALLADTEVANNVLHGVVPAQDVRLVPVRTSAQLAAEQHAQRAWNAELGTDR